MANTTTCLLHAQCNYTVLAVPVYDRKKSTASAMVTCSATTTSDACTCAADFFTSVANVRLVWLFLVMLAVYTATYFLWGIAWYIINSSSNTCVKGLNETFLSAYMFSLETQVCPCDDHRISIAGRWCPQRCAHFLLPGSCCDVRS